MKHATKYLLAIILSSSVSMADEAEDLNADPNYNPTAGTPVPVVLVTTKPVSSFVATDTVWTVKQFTIQITQFLLSPVPDLEKVKVIVSQMSIADLTGVVVSLVDNPQAFNLLVPQLTIAQTQGVAVALVNNPAAFKAFVAQMTSDQVSGVVVSLVGNPAAFKALVEQMSASQFKGVVASLASNPDVFKVLVSKMSSSQVEGVVASLVDNPKTLSLLVSTLSTEQVEKVTLDTFKTSNFCAFVSQFSTSQLTTVMVALAKNPDAMTALYNTITPAQYQQVFASLAKDADSMQVVANSVTPSEIARVYYSLTGLNTEADFKVFASKVDPGKLKRAQIDLFLIDLDAWMKFSDLLKEPDAAATAGRLGNNWMDAARKELRKQYDKEGFSPSVIAKAEAMMARAKQAAAADEKPAPKAFATPIVRH